MKPISELAFNRKDCEVIAKELFYTYQEMTSINPYPAGHGVIMYFNEDFIAIRSDGTIYVDRPLRLTQFNPFKFVKLLTELGYEPKR